MSFEILDLDNNFQILRLSVTKREMTSDSTKDCLVPAGGLSEPIGLTQSR